MFSQVSIDVEGALQKVAIINGLFNCQIIYIHICIFVREHFYAHKHRPIYRRWAFQCHFDHSVITTRSYTGEL